MVKNILQSEQMNNGMMDIIFGEEMEDEEFVKTIKKTEEKEQEKSKMTEDLKDVGVLYFHKNTDVVGDFILEQKFSERIVQNWEKQEIQKNTSFDSFDSVHRPTIPSSSSYVHLQSPIHPPPPLSVHHPVPPNLNSSYSIHTLHNPFQSQTHSSSTSTSKSSKKKRNVSSSSSKKDLSPKKKPKPVDPHNSLVLTESSNLSSTTSIPKKKSYPPPPPKVTSTNFIDLVDD